MILPPGVDLATVSEGDLIAAYVAMGLDPDAAEVKADVLLNGDPAFPFIA